MMKKNLLFILTLLISANCFGWGQKGHDTVAYIALQHLTPVTLSSLDSLLDNKSIVYWANWLDNASHTPEYAYTKTWHYKNIDADMTFENAPKIEEGNIVDAIYEQVEVLNDNKLEKKDKALAVKMLVHFLGDIHQPMHMGHASDRGGNNHIVKFFNKPSNLHTVWDTKILESAHAWSHTEWQRELDRLNKEEEDTFVMNGTPDIWGKETYEISKKIYDATPQDTNIEYSYIAEWTPTIELQLEKGGLRLADILNSIFDPSYIPLNSFISKE